VPRLSALGAKEAGYLRSACGSNAPVVARLLSTTCTALADLAAARTDLGDVDQPRRPHSPGRGEWSRSFPPRLVTHVYVRTVLHRRVMATLA